MKKTILFIFISFLNFSCTSEKENQDRKNILGEWLYSVEVSTKENSEEPPSPFVFDPPNFIFKKMELTLIKMDFSILLNEKIDGKIKFCISGEKQNSKYAQILYLF